MLRFIEGKVLILKYLNRTGSSLFSSLFLPLHFFHRAAQIQNNQQITPRVNNSTCFLQERQRQLESLGISLQSSGIRVVNDKCFLVNLNADPALNELLVYYLKVQHTHTAQCCSPVLTHVLFICVTASPPCPGAHTCGLGQLAGHPAVRDGHPRRALRHRHHREQRRGAHASPQRSVSTPPEPMDRLLGLHSGQTQMHLIYE